MCSGNWCACRGQLERTFSLWSSFIIGNNAELQQTISRFQRQRTNRVVLHERSALDVLRPVQLRLQTQVCVQIFFNKAEARSSDNLLLPFFLKPVRCLDLGSERLDFIGRRHPVSKSVLGGDWFSALLMLFIRLWFVCAGARGDVMWGLGEEPIVIQKHTVYESSAQ